ncbi:hypothetical protein SAMN06272735_4826 [Streptomyces sp. TLI_55]|uniref:hypothetical protein n=1 Tax=Streptomyces sp. TLI_55 TaxID=1938861 RepID=UPI000BD1E259|nr:hypothetical protein [Streptomyces sp. TLI_55]SNX63029.1 hypothetical protein SAMN06272735_4826 [Streptomyces sp. TLI_55]
MPRGRHRHSPPLHRLLPPSAIAGVSLVCAFGPWVFSQQAVLRVIAASAAATAVVGAAVMRRWDAQAGKQVADLTRARASDEWRFEERVAELESDLEESRELRAKLEQRLRAKRSELAGLRNEHAALLRRYATAETERASALEGRRLLEIETAVPARELPPASVPVPGGAVEETEAVAAPVEDADVDVDVDVESAGAAEAADDEPETPAIFSPEGSQLFLRAKVALARLDAEDAGAAGKGGEVSGDSVDADDADDAEDSAVAAYSGDSVKGDEAPEDVTAAAAATDVTEVARDVSQEAPQGEGSPKGGGSPKGDGTPDGDGGPKGDGPARSVPAQAGPVAAEVAAPGDSAAEAAQEDEAQGQPAAADEHERAAAVTTTAAKPAQPVQQPSGHFVAPTAVAVVPAAPVRRPAVQGGFDFFGAQKASAALEAVQNEDLADVVGQEALALHKAEAESEFKPADEESRGAGQVIDLTAHDETEQIDLQGLRSAVS